MLECGWLEIGDTWYYFDEETCAMRTGWLELDGAAYYFDESSGAMATGWRWIDGAWYSLRPTGVLERGWLLEGDTWYWLDRETGAGERPMRNRWYPLWFLLEWRYGFGLVLL